MLRCGVDSFAVSSETALKRLSGRAAAEDRQSLSADGKTVGGCEILQLAAGFLKPRQSEDASICKGAIIGTELLPKQRLWNIR